MPFDKIRGNGNGNHQFALDRVRESRENDQATMCTNVLLFPASSSSSSSSTSTPSSSIGGLNYIEHHVSKFDTLAGVAIRYGVEVADIKRMNNLVTDLQMFALKSLQIPLPGRHPPSSSLANGSATPGQKISGQSPSRRHSDVLESIQSLRLKSAQHKVSPAMSTLQGYYGLKHSSKNGVAETEMAIYKTDSAYYLEDELPKSSSLSNLSSGLHRKSRSLVNGFLPENGELLDVLVVEAGDLEAERSNDKSVRRRQKAENDSASRTPEMLLKEDNSGGSGFSTTAGRGLALRPKSGSRANLAADADSGSLYPVPVGLGDFVIADGSSGVRKSSSTSSLQDQDNNNSSSIWPTSKWSLKTDLQALSAVTIARPIFDGLPKPITGRRNKAALD
ncbi:uncharacterized protein LOC122081420 [Macadamia integrifolia]|uniref:uncharacterized protein LOC122081420 n=1 Tax=Macadamia integrifolia TaxID=60698 RepID=UPI001C4E4067|nr:uncharacterized protein LOC122081420 [Macadamia integrifolia]